MSRQLVAALVLAVSLPVGVGAPVDSISPHPGDRPGTRARLAAGGGDYDVFDVFPACEGGGTIRGRVSHADAGLQVEHESNSGGYVVGARAGALHETVGHLLVNDAPSDSGGGSRTVWYVNPYVAREGRLIGLGIGGVVANKGFIASGLKTESEPASLHVRLGRRDGLYLALRYMEAIPLSGAGGYGDWGIGLPLGRSGVVWVGKGFDAPSEVDTWAIQADARLGPQLSILGGGFVGSRDGSDGRGIRNTGWHIGLEWRGRPAEAYSYTSPR
jgi:hypothetical protein